MNILIKIINFIWTQKKRKKFFKRKWRKHSNKRNRNKFNHKRKYESKNVFISLNNTNDNNKEYLFSYGKYSDSQKTIAELYDINVWKIKKKDCYELLGQKMLSDIFFNIL